MLSYYKCKVVFILFRLQWLDLFLKNYLLVAICNFYLISLYGVWSYKQTKNVDFIYYIRFNSVILLYNIIILYMKYNIISLYFLIHNLICKVNLAWILIVISYIFVLKYLYTLNCMLLKQFYIKLYIKISFFKNVKYFILYKLWICFG